MNQKSKPEYGEELSAFQVASVTIGAFGFIPWILSAIRTPETQSLSAWLCWAVISVAVAISRKSQGQNYALWTIWAIGDIVVLVVTVWSGGNHWVLEKNLPLMAASLIALETSLRTERKYAKISEGTGSLALLMGHVMMWIDQYALPPVTLFFLLSPLAGLIAPLLDGGHECWKARSLKGLTISTTMAIFVGVVLLWLMAT